MSEENNISEDAEINKLSSNDLTEEGDQNDNQQEEEKKTLMAKPVVVGVAAVIILLLLLLVLSFLKSPSSIKTQVVQPSRVSINDCSEGEYFYESECYCQATNQEASLISTNIIMSGCSTHRISCDTVKDLCEANCKTWAKDEYLTYKGSEVDSDMCVLKPSFSPATTPSALPSPSPSPMAQLVLIKNVVGGNANEDDFNLQIDGETVSSFEIISLLPGTYQASEEQVDGYVAMPSGWGTDCDSDGFVTLAAGDFKVCTISNELSRKVFVSIKDADPVIEGDPPGLHRWSSFEIYLHDKEGNLVTLREGEVVEVLATTVSGSAVKRKDFVGSEDSFTIIAGQSSKTYKVGIIPDEIKEDEESFFARIEVTNTQAETHTNTAVGSITDDDGASETPLISPFE